MTIRLYESVKRFLKDESGPTAVEYGVILALILLALISSVQFFGSITNGSFTNSATEIESAINGGS